MSLLFLEDSPQIEKRNPKSYLHLPTRFIRNVGSSGIGHIIFRKRYLQPFLALCTLFFLPAMVHAYSITVAVKTTAGTPIAGVTLNLDGKAVTPTMNAMKEYVISGVAAGFHSVTPSKAGWTFSQAYKSLTVSASSPAGRVEFTGSGALKITGQVYKTHADGSTHGIRNATVTLNGTTYKDLTDVDGNFIISDLQPGTYTVSASSRFFNITPASRNVTIPSSGLYYSPDGLANFNATGKYNIRGRVLTGAGAGIAGAKVICSGSDATGGSSGVQVVATTDANGNYTCANLPSGKFTVLPVNTTHFFTPGSLAVTLPTSGQTYSPNGWGSFRGASAGNAKALLPIAYYFVKDSNGWALASNAEGVLFFEPNGVAQLYLSFPNDAISYKGTYTYNAGTLHLKFNDADLVVDSTFALNTTLSTVTMPFKLGSTGAGSSTWQKKSLSTVQALSTLFKAVTVNENLFYDQALARVLAYAYEIIAMNAQTAPAQAAAATPTPKLKQVEPIEYGVKLQYDSGPDFTLLLFGWGSKPGQPLTWNQLSTDPRLNLDVNPSSTDSDPISKSAVLISPFYTARILVWYDVERYSRRSKKLVQDFHFPSAADDNIAGMKTLLTNRGYAVAPPMNDANVTVRKITDEMLKSPGLVYISTHGVGGVLSTGQYLGNTKANGEAAIRTAFTNAATSLLLDSSYSGIVGYKRDTTKTVPDGLRTLTLIALPTDMHTTVSGFIAVTPYFWEALRVVGGADFSDSLIYIGSCDADTEPYVVKAAGFSPLYLRDAIRAKSYFAFRGSADSKFAGASFQYLVKHLSRRTHTAEEAYYNILRVASTRQMIYTEDRLLNNTIPLQENEKDENGNPFSFGLFDMFRGYGCGPTTSNRVVSYQTRGWLGGNLLTDYFDPGEVWWLLFGGRWGQDAQDSADAIKNVCYKQFWSKGDAGGLASPGCNAWAGGRLPYTQEVGYSMYLLSGTPVFSTVKPLVPRWTLNDSLAP